MSSDNGEGFGLQGPHSLQNRWTFWHTLRTTGPRASLNAATYESTLELIGEFWTIEDFWGIFCHIDRPKMLKITTDLALFKGFQNKQNGVRPMWEDSANRGGGKYIIRVKKQFMGRAWEEMVLALVGEQVKYAEFITGAVLSIRVGDNVIHVWTRALESESLCSALRESIRKIIGLPSYLPMDYKPHPNPPKQRSGND